MQRINKNTVGVYNYLGLRDAIENTTILLFIWVVVYSLMELR